MHIASLASIKIHNALVELERSIVPKQNSDSL
jgi:hypothetical protein